MSNECMSLPPFPIFLRACPFCGNVPEIEEAKSGGNIFKKKKVFFYVRCPVCRATSAPDFAKDKVARLWNRRAGHE